VYGIVRQSGGGVAVHSELNRGTVFRIYLPRVEEEAAPVKPSASPAAATVRGCETVLLVEDDEKVRPLVRRMLERAGYVVLEARHGEEAVFIAKQHPGTIDLLLTDVIMPEMSGSELAAELRRDRRALNILFMSGYTDSFIAGQGPLEPGFSLIMKPFGEKDLLRAVRNVLDKKPPPDAALSSRL
jgi:CheY-like chemotaxis protein